MTLSYEVIKVLKNTPTTTIKLIYLTNIATGKITKKDEISKIKFGSNFSVCLCCQEPSPRIVHVQSLCLCMQFPRKEGIKHSYLEIGVSKQCERISTTPSYSVLTRSATSSNHLLNSRPFLHRPPLL